MSEYRESCSCPASLVLDASQPLEDLKAIADDWRISHLHTPVVPPPPRAAGTP